MAPRKKKVYTKKTASADSQSTQRKSSVSKTASTKPVHQSLVADYRSRLPNFIVGVVVVLALLFLLIAGLNRSAPQSIAQSGLFSLFENKKTEETAVVEEKERAKTTDYIVQEGDYLWSIAEAAYGSGFNAYDIATANKLQAPYILEPGQKLVLPSVEPSEPTVGEVTDEIEPTMTVARSKPTTYTTREGDYLAKIAQEVYGTSDTWYTIYEANMSQIYNPDILPIGMTLTIPTGPGQSP